jgi:gliding motility-associated-like protein
VVVLSEFCIDTVSVSIAVTPLPQVDAGMDDTICTGASVLLNGSGTGSFSWSPTAGLSNPGVKDPIATPTSTTTFILTVENSGCTSTDSVTIFVKPRPTINAGPDVSVCPGDSVTINASGSGIISWLPAIGLSNPAVINPVAFPLQTTNYILTVDSGGCESKDTMTITIKPVPQANAGADKIICAGDSIQLNGTGTGSISWTPVTGLNDPGILNPVASPAQTTTYYLSVIDDGCENIDSMTVTVNPLPYTDAGADVSVCEGGSVQLAGSGSGTVAWTPTSGLSNPAILNPFVSPSQTTVYVLSIDSGGCKNVDSLEVTVIALPQVEAGIHDTVCAGASVQLIGQGTGIISWSPAASLNNPAILNPLSTPAQTTQYFLTIESNGCVNTDSVTIVVKPLPQISAGADASMCEGESVQLNGSGTGIVSWSPSNFLNNSNIINPVASPLQTTIYVLTVDSGGCESFDSVTVTVIPLPRVNAGADVTICAGTSIQLSAQGANDYIWTPGDGLNNSTVPNPIATPLVTTTYLVTGIKEGCASNDTIMIYVNQLPIVNAGNDTILNYKINFTLNGYPANGNWSSESGLFCTGCSSYDIIAEQNEGYYYNYTDSAGCENTDTINIKINRTCPEPWFPGAFTPNDDFINDIFKPVFDNINVITDIEFIIYNRWGEQVFYTKDINVGWDGKSTRASQNMDMFLYRFLYNCEGKTNMINGRLMLIK